MKPNEDFIDVEVIEAQIVVCPKCGQKNRTSTNAGVRFRCGSCKFELSPLSKSQPVGLLAKARIHFRQHPNWYFIGALVSIGIPALMYLNKPGPGPMPYQAVPPPEQTPVPTSPSVQPQSRQIIYARPSVAPDGQPWPTRSSYLRGFPRLHANGLSEVTVDNSQNGVDFLVKLVSLQGPQAFPVRTFYIPANGVFTIKNISAGSYDIRYRNLVDGTLARSESFGLEETQTKSGTQYSIITMTLYRVPHGNLHTYELPGEEF
jgi:hypothetical protein